MGSPSPVANILIVDDNASVARSLKLVLVSEGYAIDCAGTAREALTMAGGKAYEAALIDISLPDRSGIDLLPELRRLHPSLVAVIVTGHASTESSIDALNRGASGYVRKPVEVQQLLALLRTGLEKRELEEEKRLMLRRLSLLHAVGATVSAGLEPGETLSETLSLVVSLLDLPAGAIWWGGAPDQELRLASSMGLSGALIDRLAADIQRRMADQTTQGKPPEPSGAEFQVDCPADGAYWRFRVLSLRGNRQPIAWLAVGGSENESDENEDPGFLAAVAGQLGIAMDNMQLYESLRSAYDQLKEAQVHAVRSEKLSALSRIVSGVTHELNNPLTAILGYCEVLVNDGVREEALPVVGRLGDQARRCSSIVKELAAFAEPEEMFVAAVDIDEVLSSALEAAEHCRDQHTEVIWRLREPLPQTTGDAQALRQALTNVIVNAYQAMEGRDGALTIETRTDNGDILLVVSDTGPGISNDILPRIFDPFYTTKGVGQGTGLGLSVSHGIVREHGGELTADNRPDGGAIFRMRLPVRRLPTPIDPDRTPDPDFATEYAPWLKQ